jgi:hypothetical protein
MLGFCFLDNVLHAHHAKAGGKIFALQGQIPLPTTTVA